MQPEEVGRRTFVGAITVGLPLLAGTGAGALALHPSGHPARASTPDARIPRALRQVTAEGARLFKEVRRHGPRREHFRAAAANLRMFATIIPEDDIQQSIARQIRSHGRERLLAHRLDTGMIRRELRKFDLEVSDSEFGIGRASYAERAKALDHITTPGVSVSGVLLQLSALLDETGTRIADAGHGVLRRVEFSDCQTWIMYWSALAVGTEILCALGAIAGCAAAGISLVLIMLMMSWAGC